MNCSKWLSSRALLRKSEKEIILQIISLDQRTARDVMRPRAGMACISDDATVEEMIAAAKKFKHRRLPIYDETPDTIVGILNTRALLLDPNIDLAEVIEFPSFVPETMNLLQLFRSLQKQQRGLAVVLDEFGGVAGLVTMEDILGQIVGKIYAALQPEGFVMEKLAPDRWRVSGSMRMDDFRREFPGARRNCRRGNDGRIAGAFVRRRAGDRRIRGFSQFETHGARRGRTPRAGTAWLSGSNKMNAELVSWIVLALCLMLSFLLSGMEAGVFALSRLHVRRLARAGKPSAKLLNRFLENPERFLWTILVGNTLANFLILGFLLVKICEWFLGNRALIIVIFAAVVFLFYTFFDLLPKMLFRAFPNQLCLSAARVFRLVNFVLSPLVSLVEGVSRTILRMTGGKVVHRSPVRQPRGNARRHAANPPRRSPATSAQ